jgi:hypothetical protein
VVGVEGATLPPEDRAHDHGNGTGSMEAAVGVEANTLPPEDGALYVTWGYSGPHLVFGVSGDGAGSLETEPEAMVGVQGPTLPTEDGADDSTEAGPAAVVGTEGPIIPPVDSVELFRRACVRARSFWRRQLRQLKPGRWCPGCRQAELLTRADRTAEEGGMSKKPEHQHCHECNGIARRDFDGDCSICGFGKVSSDDDSEGDEGAPQPPSGGGAGHDGGPCTATGQGDGKQAGPATRKNPEEKVPGAGSSGPAGNEPLEPAAVSKGAKDAVATPADTCRKRCRSEDPEGACEHRRSRHRPCPSCGLRLELVCGMCHEEDTASTREQEQKKAEAQCRRRIRECQWQCQEQLHAIRLQREKDERRRQISVARLQEGCSSLPPRTAPA